MSEDEEFVTVWTAEREWAAKGQEVKRPFDPEKIKVYLDGVKPNVSSQPHYTASAIQPIEFIEANDLDFFEGCIVKYVSRWRHKDGIRDLEKLVDYATRLLKREQDRAK